MGGDRSAEVRLDNLHNPLHLHGQKLPPLTARQCLAEAAELGIDHSLCSSQVDHIHCSSHRFSMFGHQVFSQLQKKQSVVLKLSEVVRLVFLFSLCLFWVD
jgi:hypothetical protein